MAELNDAHKAQVQRFLAFFKGKRDRLLVDRESEKDDFKNDRLPSDDAVFNKTDVEDLLDTYHAQIVGGIREALEEFINVSAVYVSQVFLAAEQSSLIINAGDVSSIENQNTVADITSMVTTGKAPKPAVKRNVSSVLQKMFQKAPKPAVKAAANDPVLVQKIQELEQENVQLHERLQLLEAQRAVLSDQLATAGSPVAAPERFNSNSTQLKELEAILNKKTSEIELLRDVLTTNGISLPGTSGFLDLATEEDWRREVAAGERACKEEAEAAEQARALAREVQLLEKQADMESRRLGWG